jgi:hypothetical protein
VDLCRPPKLSKSSPHRRRILLAIIKLVAIFAIGIPAVLIFVVVFAVTAMIKTLSLFVGTTAVWINIIRMAPLTPYIVEFHGWHRKIDMQIVAAVPSRDQDFRLA